MFSSSPSSSTGSPRITRSHPAAPPRRTYSRKRTVQAPKNQDVSDTDSDTDEVGKNRIDGKKETAKIQANAKRTSQSSPSLGSSTRTRSEVSRTGSSSASRLSRNESRGRERTSTTGTKVSEASTTGEAEEDSIMAAEYHPSQEERYTPKMDRTGRAQTLIITSSPLTSASGPPTPTPRKRKAEPSLRISPAQPSVRATRSRSNTSQNSSESKKAPVPRRRDLTPPRSVAAVAGPSTPTSSPRDYAHLFAAISPDPSILSSPSRKRVIGQSQSSGAILESPSKLRRGFSHIYDSPGRAGPSTPTKTLTKTQSMPITPSKVSEEGDPSAMWIKPVEPEGQGSGGRAKRIYGRTRTVVAEDDDTVSDVQKLEEALAKESYASLRRRYEVNSGETTQSHEDLSTLIIARAPQSANDMKSKGENRRFMDETGYLLDGIEDETGTRSFRRASCVDILTNMQDEEWMSKLNVCGQTERVWAAFEGVREEGDDIMDAVCLLALFVIMNGIAGGENILFRADATECIRFVASLLKERNGVLDESWTGKATPMVERVRGVGKNVQPTSHSSTRHLASAILTSFVKASSTDMLNQITRPEKVMGKTLKAILPEITTLSERFDHVKSGLSLVPKDDSIDLHHIRNCLAVIDHLVASSVEERYDLAHHHAGLPQGVLRALIAFVKAALGSDAEYAYGSAARGIFSCLRIFANMGNVAPSWSREIQGVEGAWTALARIIVNREWISTSIPKAPEERTETIDEDELLCLVLSVMTSAVLMEGELSSVLGSLRLDPECTGHSICVTSCHCLSAEPFVNEVARLYVSFQDDSSPLESKVVAAYLALLLSKFIIAVPSVYIDIADSLIGDDRQSKLNRIVTSLRALDGFRSVLKRNGRKDKGMEDEQLEEDGNVVTEAIDNMVKFVNTN